jgi:uncharacterized protein YyaL (SSP411 family)
VNRLARERSPYLLQHAHNPVAWFPWSEEAFAAARAEDKPIFLSIGYSTCHWCHVMEHESFEDASVADVLNEHFVAIKVDREERPDVDRVYMAFVQATTGSGGWPMSVWLTPDLKPFYGGTYFPPTSRWGRPGFVDILLEIARVWRTDRAKVQESAESLTTQLRAAGRDASSQRVAGAEALQRILAQFRQMFDHRNGGFGDAPKFPRPSELLFLMREHARTGDGDAREMTLATLRAMACGGMRDHIGGGFHRYSVDARWRVPHFEKMLYDQAQLTLAFLEAAQMSGDGFYQEVAEDTLQYVMRQMTDDAGGFYSAEDADSVPPEQAAGAAPRKMEGAFYLWRAGEIDELLGEDAAVVKRRFGIMPEGNAPSDPQQEFTGKNLLFLDESVEAIAARLQQPESRITEVLERARLAMFRARVSRPRPHLDDKVLTAWNGLMIAAFARAARVVQPFGDSGGSGGRRAYLDAARRAAAFLHARMWKGDEEVLLRRYRDGHAEIEGYAEDYAFLIFGLLELFQADPDPKWLSWAATLQKRQDELFWDESDGGWFSTTGRDPHVLFRMKEDYDGAEPAASSVSVWNLLTLSHLIEDARWMERIERTLGRFAERLEQAGRAVPMMAAALSTHLAGARQIVIVGDEGAGDLERVVASRYQPFAISLTLSPAQQAALASILPFVAAMKPINGRAAAYVCRDFACLEPANSPAVLEKQLSPAGQSGERSGTISPDGPRP